MSREHLFGYRDENALVLALRDADHHAVRNREEILASDMCGCFSCLATFPPERVTDWDGAGEPEERWSAFCPECGDMAVIGDRDGFPITPEFLAKVHDFWRR